MDLYRALATALGLAASGCSGISWAQSPAADSWKAVLTAAQKEARVVVYSAHGTKTQERMAADFRKLFPAIAVEFARMPGATAVSKLEQERTTGADGADVAVLAEVLYLDERAAAGSIKPPSGPAARTWPSAYMIRGAVPILGIEPQVIAYNTGLVQTPITGYRDLLKPEFAGRIGTTEIVSTLIVAWYEWLEKTQGADFLAKLAKQRPRLYAGSAPSVQAAISGEVKASMQSPATTALPLIESGAPLKMVVPNPSFGIRYAGGIMGWSKRPNAALLFMDYLMSPLGQDAFCGKGGGASPLPNLPGCLDPRTIASFDANYYTREVVEAYRKKWNALFKN